jgi:TM2 domain-containing membrane protein YozV
MKTMKKLLAILLAAMMILACIPFMSYASDAGANEKTASAIMDEDTFNKLMDQNPALKQAVEAAAAKKKVSPYDWFTTILLAILVGGFGVHRFYVGKMDTGLIWLLTGGGLGIGVIYDVIMIATGQFTDGNGLPIVRQ